MKLFRNVLIFLIIALGMFLFLMELEKGQTSSCDRVLSIARDNGKLAYMRSWIKGRLADEGFFLHMGKLGESNALDAPAHFAELKIDTEYLGIDKSMSFVRLNTGTANTASIKDRFSVKSISIGEGRSSITFILDESGDHGILGFSNIQQSVRLRNGDLIVVCR